MNHSLSLTWEKKSAYALISFDFQLVQWNDFLFFICEWLRFNTRSNNASNIWFSGTSAASVPAVLVERASESKYDKTVLEWQPSVTKKMLYLAFLLVLSVNRLSYLWILNYSLFLSESYVYHCRTILNPYRSNV